MRSYRIFISHAWKYGEYNRIIEFLDQTENFSYSNYSLPLNKAVDGLNDKKLSYKIRSHIQLSQIVLVPMGMEINYRRYLQFEVEVAQEMSKPIIGIMPLGRKRRPKIIVDAAWKIVGWRSKSIVKSIQNYAI